MRRSYGEQQRNRIVIVGVPRSGSTWVATMLSRAAGAAFVGEPDNHLIFPAALRAKRRLGRGYYPHFTAGEAAPEYEEIWRQAIGDRGVGYTPPEFLRRALARMLWATLSKEKIRQTFLPGPSFSASVRIAEALAVPERPSSGSRDVIVKSVYAPLAVDWIAQRFDVRVVVLLRNVRNVISSWAELGWLGSVSDDELSTVDPAAIEAMRLKLGLPEVPVGPPIARLAWLLGALTLSLEQAARSRPEWIVVRHETLCREPRETFRDLASRLGLQWTEAADGALVRSNRHGRGSDLHRVALELPNAWRTRLRREDIDHIEPVLASFPLEATF